MEINTTLSAAEQAKTKMTVDTFNKTLAVKGRNGGPEIGKNEFLKVFLDPLLKQNPTRPIENTAFISQKAQFSSLEQMTNMSTEFAKLANMLNSNEAVSLLGKNVTISTGDTSVNGVVEAVTRGEDPQVEVNGMLYSMDQIKSVYGD